jgi:hypothetical protein
MSKIKTDLFAKSNAVLTNDEGKVIAIISCDVNEDISRKVALAIKEDYISEKVVIEESENTFTSEKPFDFSAVVFDSDMEDFDLREFTLTICATY